MFPHLGKFIPSDSYVFLRGLSKPQAPVISVISPAQDPNEKALEEDPDPQLENLDDLDPVASPKSPKRLDAQSDASLDTTEERWDLDGLGWTRWDEMGTWGWS